MVYESWPVYQQLSVNEKRIAHFMAWTRPVADKNHVQAKLRLSSGRCAGRRAKQVFARVSTGNCEYPDIAAGNSGPQLLRFVIHCIHGLESKASCCKTVQDTGRHIFFNLMRATECCQKSILCGAIFGALCEGIAEPTGCVAHWSALPHQLAARGKEPGWP